MKLHEMKQKRNTIATDMRALHDKIGDTTWTEEQRTQWNAAKSELDALDERIAREEELRRHDQSFVDEQEPEQRQRQEGPEMQAEVRRAAAFDRLLRHGFGELTAEERQAVKELRAQGTTPDDKGGYTVPTQMRNTIIDAMKADDLLMITADHGNDPSYVGTDHTREYIPLVIFSKSLKDPKVLPVGHFADISATVAENFSVKKAQTGESFLDALV